MSIWSCLSVEITIGLAPLKLHRYWYHSKTFRILMCLSKSDQVQTSFLNHGFLRRKLTISWSKIMDFRQIIWRTKICGFSWEYFKALPDQECRIFTRLFWWIFWNILKDFCVFPVENYWGTSCQKKIVNFLRHEGRPVQNCEHFQKYFEESSDLVDFMRNIKNKTSW